MAKKGLMLAVRVVVGVNLLFAAIVLKFGGVAVSVAAFTAMSNAMHGLVSEPVFRIGAGAIETVLAVLFLIPRTAKTAAALIFLWMIPVILSHIFVLGYGLFFIDAVAMFVLPGLYLLLARAESGAPKTS